MLSASPATAALEICCVWWTTKEEALADAAPYHRPVRVGARRFLGEHVEELLGGRRNATQSFHEHQPRYGEFGMGHLRDPPPAACYLDSTLSEYRRLRPRQKRFLFSPLFFT